MVSVRTCLATGIIAVALAACATDERPGLSHQRELDRLLATTEWELGYEGRQRREFMLTGGIRVIETVYPDGERRFGMNDESGYAAPLCVWKLYAISAAQAAVCPQFSVIQAWVAKRHLDDRTDFIIRNTTADVEMMRALADKRFNDFVNRIRELPDLETANACILGPLGKEGYPPMHTIQPWAYFPDDLGPDRYPASNPCF